MQASEGESTDLPPDGILYDPDTTAENPATAGRFDVTRSLEHWSAGDPNYGWMLESAATNGWDYTTKEGGSGPRLVVDWTAPAGAGSVGFLELTPSVGEGVGVVELSVARLGGTDGEITVNFAITAEAGDTATGDTDFTVASGALTFADGASQATVPLSVEILDDTDLEGNETFTVTLSNGSGTVVAGREVATVSIGDDDALINEVLANISDAAEGNTTGDETNDEYIELIGTPNASLDGYYFVVFEAEEEEPGGQDDGDPTTDGHGTGVADFVVDLSGLTFGSNGLIVLVPGDSSTPEIETWAYASVAAAGTNIVESTR